jgi:TPR repeat protein
MQNSLTITGFSLSRRFLSLWFVAILALFLAPARLPAQQTEVPATPACAPSNLASLIVREGQSVRVGSVEEPSFHASGNTATAANNSAPSANVVREQEAAYKTLEKDARHGSLAAQVNLAVASLAGWGVPPNAGTALYWLHAAAAKDYAPALFDLGILYSRGCGVHQDFSDAFRFFQAAAISGDMAAAVNLGYLYDQGLGVTQDRSEASRWYRQAAERGEPTAQYNLADLYLRGAGVPLDESLAFSWFQKAALQGHSGARIMLGSMLAEGCGTRKDLQAAYLWLSAASLQGDPRGDATLRSLEQQLTPEQIEEATKQAHSLPHSNPQSPVFARLQ